MGILGNEGLDALARLGSLPEGDLIVGTGLLICNLYGLINGWVRAEALGNGSSCYVSSYLWPAVDGVRTGWLLGLDRASLRLVISYFKRYD